MNIKKYLSCHLPPPSFLGVVTVLLSLALPKTNIAPEKYGGWETTFLWGNPIFAMLVFREGNPRKQTGQP